METVCSEGFGFRCSVRAASEVEIGLPSNYPERRRLSEAAGASTVDAREKELSLTVSYDAPAGDLVVSRLVTQ
jgi:hypothetical protein